MTSQEIIIRFSSIKFEGEDAKEARKMLKTDGLSITRSTTDDLEDNDDRQTVMLTNLSSEDDRMVIEDTLEDEIECALSEEFDDAELVDYKIDWVKSEICVWSK